MEESTGTASANSSIFAPKEQQNQSIVNKHFLAAINSLLESIKDKDESLRNSIENAFGRMIDGRPNETLGALYDFRQKYTRLGEPQIAITLRVIEKFTASNTHKIRDEILPKIIDLCIKDITCSQDQNIQTSGVQTLVAIGRMHCDTVMEKLLNQFQQGQVAHFMILHCMGTLATANIAGIITFVKPTLEMILPTLSMIRLDHIKQAYAFGIGHFAEAITEHSATASITQKNNSIGIESIITAADFHTEIAIAYEVFLQQWLPNRDPKVSAEILQALSHMYPLLSTEKINEQSSRIVPQLLGFYRRSIDRNANTQLLASVLKTTIDNDAKLLDAHSDVLLSSLFDLVCVNPVYEKPQTVKGHYEVLRCFDLLVEIQPDKVFEMLLVQLRNNNERERIKSLLVVTHLINTFDYLISPRIGDFLPMLKQMLTAEKTFKFKMALLKTIVALSQRDIVVEADFIRFMLRHSCQLVRVNNEHGTADEHQEFLQACNNSLFILSTTVRTMDIILKQVLLHYYLVADYTDICSNIAKCLANLFAKSIDPLFMMPGDDAHDAESQERIQSLPSPEAIFVRSIVLLGNVNEPKRNENILLFLKYYGPLVSDKLKATWATEMPGLQSELGQPNFIEKLFAFVLATVHAVNDYKFAETLVTKVADQIVLYPHHVMTSGGEFVVLNFSRERGMLLKLLGLCLGSVTDSQTIEAKIDMIFSTVRAEKIDRGASGSAAAGEKLADACEALGFAARVHCDTVLRKLESVRMDEGMRKSNSGFFGGLNFIKDAGKEAEMLKINLLAIEAYAHIVRQAPEAQVLPDIETKIMAYLAKQLTDTKDAAVRKSALTTILTTAKKILKSKAPTDYRLPSKKSIFIQLLKIDFMIAENLPLFAIVMQVATTLLRIEPLYEDATATTPLIDSAVLFGELCRRFFTCAQQLKSKFESVDDDAKNSWFALHLNATLPELNAFARTMFEQSATPSTLDDVQGVLEFWIRDPNSEVKICVSHVMYNALEVYMKTVKIGCEAPSKFNQTGSMLAKIIPRCIDTNATVRQTSIDIVQKILEISNIYESLTIPDSDADWIVDLQTIRKEIVTDDPKEIYRIASELARIIAGRLSNLQHMQFCKILLNCLNDGEQSSAIGASVVLKFFIQIKGSEFYHCIPEFVKEALTAVNSCGNPRAKSGVLKALVALTKHHPKLVCSEMLGQSLPFEGNVIDYWKTIALDAELFATILDNFLTILASSCLHESTDTNNAGGTGTATGDRQQIATVHPFSIFCALHEMLNGKEIQSVLKQKFADLFCVLLTSLAVYTNLAPPMLTTKAAASAKTGSTPSSSKAKFGFIPNKEAVKMNPCQIVLETFQSFLDTLEMDQISAVLSVCPHLATSTELNNFMEILTPMAVGLVNQLGIVSAYLKQVIATLSKYVASPYDAQRIAAVGLYSQMVPLKPTGEIASVIMLHLSSALSDPNPLIRGFCIRGFAYVGHLCQHDIDKYSEASLSALLKGVDDNNPNSFINIPLESLRGLSRVLATLPADKRETFQISLSIRIRPFYENASVDIREAAILLFGNLCHIEVKSSMENGVDGDGEKSASSAAVKLTNAIALPVSEALKEQLLGNLFSMLLHLSENSSIIVRACKVTLRKLCALIDAPKVKNLIQSHLIDYGQLNYDFFIVNLMKIIGEELNDKIPDFIESCIPFLKSSWSELRGNAAVIIGLLHNLNRTNQLTTESVGQKLSVLLKDEQNSVRIKAANALGLMFSDLI